nr:relaxase/mobilization nuclease domain-containing protein [Vibrio algivorus]
MIVKFFSRGAGRGSGAVDYLLGKDRNRDGATLNQGEPDLIQDLIDSSPFERKYTSGVLSFEEENLPQETKDRLMKDFEEALLPGLDKNQYSILWIEHRDKERLELNFVVPNIELQTGKRLQPYFDRADRPRINAFKDIKNIELGLSEPRSPEKAQALITTKDLSEDKKKATQSITNSLIKLAQSGDIKNRDDVIDTLEKSGFTVARQTNKSLSLADPEGGRNIRLKGMIYERDFRFSENLGKEIEAASGAFRSDTGERLQRARTTYQSCVAKKTSENIQRYQSRSELCREAEHVIKTSGIKNVDMASHYANNRVDFGVGHSMGTGEINRAKLADDKRTESNDRETEIPRGQHSDQQLRQSDVRPDRRERRRLSGRLQNSTGVLNDRAREAAFERIRAVTERFKEETQRVCRILQHAKQHVSDYTKGKRTDTTAGQQLERTSRDFDNGIKSFSQKVDLQKKQERKQERSRGFGMGF